jgi:hypothetical protein
VLALSAVVVLVDAAVRMLMPDDQVVYAGVCDLVSTQQINQAA